MTGKRKYADGCATSHALDLVGERWALPIARELLLGAKRFTDLRSSLPSASPNVLAQRLRELEDAGVVQRRTLPPPAASRVYELTEWGSELEPVIKGLARWGSRSPFLPIDAEMSADSLILALTTLFDPQAAEGLTARLTLHLGTDVYGVQITSGGLEAARGQADSPDLAIKTDSATLSALIWGDHSLTSALNAGDLTIDGPVAIAERFLSLFPLPPTAQIPNRD
ncbi:transcriptional regulator [Actinomadura soli]|uniref:Transcriptional regulator n=1 Tax=Actinomadura soli TaxID=2508997 RepID=A0A5C4JEC2_9ACTN|nr:winged helix-turn-helix transcriptional regulator [Actinomadura soli]TMR02183.1 transcriptional regulator [Actinomadura soli]